MQQWKRLLLLIPVAMMPPLKQKQMEKELMVNYCVDIETAVNKAIGDCLLKSSDIYLSIDLRHRYKNQYHALSGFLKLTKMMTSEIKNDI